LKADDEERRRRNDDLKLKIALERSVTEGSPDVVHSQVNKFFSQIFLQKQNPFYLFRVLISVEIRIYLIQIFILIPIYHRQHQIIVGINLILVHQLISVLQLLQV
jgi:hypothetical protein